MKTIFALLMLLTFAASPVKAEVQVWGPYQPTRYGTWYYYNPSAPAYRGPITLGVYGWVGYQRPYCEPFYPR